MERHLEAIASHLDEFDCTRGEQVIERVLPEPDGSSNAFRGRLILHPNTADDAAQHEALREGTVRIVQTIYNETPGARSASTAPTAPADEQTS